VIELAHIEGLTLREQLGRMLRFSNNYIADVLTLNLAAALNKEAPTELSSASGILSDFISRSQRTAKLSSLRTPAPIFSGSGLTPENLMSANELVSLLAHQYRDTRHFPAFYGGLVVPRDAPFQFLRTGTPAWLDRVALKTGTMDTPHSVCGIAGYLRKKDGGWMAFAVIVNGGLAKHVPLFAPWWRHAATSKDTGTPMSAGKVALRRALSIQSGWPALMTALRCSSEHIGVAQDHDAAHRERGEHRGAAARRTRAGRRHEGSGNRKRW
jgi:hypothetical protein